MTKITEIADCSACSSWSPIQSHPDLIAIGSKDTGGASFEDTGGELEIYDLNLSKAQNAPSLLVSVKTAARFASVDWTRYTANGQYPLGLVAGGMTDGTVHIWNVSALLKKTSSAPLFTVKEHANGPVAALKFHPLEPWKLATGGVDGMVLIIDMEKNQPVLSEPSKGNRQSAKITAVAWNSQVAHIVATSSGDGSVTVWDLKQCKAWCKLQVEHGPVADIMWNPVEGLYLLTASGDDRNPVIKVWDLGASTSMPLTTMTGHQAGILKASWCPHDDTLLMTCAKDNRTLLWDLTTLQPFGELPADADPSDASHQQPANPTSIFASHTINEQKHMRVDVLWSPLKRGLVLTTSLDRKVQVHSVLSLATKSGRPPKWMKPTSAVSTAFGGAVLSVGSKNRVVTVETYQEQPQVASLASRFEAELAGSSISEFCDNQRAKAKPGSVDEKTWGFMRVIFNENARQSLLGHLGYDATAIANAAGNYKEIDAATNGVGSLSVQDKHPTPPMSRSAEELVKKALLVGNFEAAVECCIQSGNLADALMLASCGGGDLWAKTQERYFQTESPKRPYLALVNNIVRGQLGDLIAASEPGRWTETLAILATYAQSEEFPTLCVTLGNRLEETGDADSACYCYMCALSIENVARIWRGHLMKASKGLKSYSLVALHELVVKVTVFMKAAGTRTNQIPDDISELFSMYASILAEQGLFAGAAKYCKGASQEAKILMDRLYRGRESQACYAEFGAAPQFPFTMTTAAQGRGASHNYSTSRASSTQQRSAQQQQYQRQPQAASAYQGYQQQQPQQQYAAAPSAPAADTLPPGWMALQDPGSGQTYYANQNTGETTWEKPAMPLQTPSPMPAAPEPAPTPTASSMKPDAKSTLVSKYGDGFITSASHPELAYQYGNVGTANPYTGVQRPGTAQLVMNTHTSKPIEAAPKSGPVDLDSLELSAENAPIKDTLYALHEHLVAYATVAEKRQLEESRKGLDILMKKLSRGQLDEDVTVKLREIVGSLSNHDFRAAVATQTALVNSDWKYHKDWLKGLKSLLQLAAKKLSG